MQMLSVVRAVVLMGAVLVAAPAAVAQISAQRLALCAGCHGADGNSQLKGRPSLAAQPKLFLENQLVLIREGVRDVPSMKSQRSRNTIRKKILRQCLRTEMRKFSRAAVSWPRV